MTEQQSGLVFDIQRFCVHDGPGIRTTVFLKGCSLSCGWCHNPEGIQAMPQVMFNAEKCIDCQACATACDRSVHIFKADGQRAFYPERCTGCGACARICPSEALTLVGRKMTVDEVIAKVLRDKPFFGADGGMTVSGGEVFLQVDFLRALLYCAQSEGLNTVVDTSGYADWATLEMTLSLTNLYLFDIKAFSPALHRKITGVDNVRILENLRRLDAEGANIWIRMPLLRGINDSLEELRGTARFLAELSCVERIEMMPYHILGRAKYAILGREKQSEFYAPTKEELQKYKELFLGFGLTQVS